MDLNQRHGQKRVMTTVLLAFSFSLLTWRVIASHLLIRTSSFTRSFRENPQSFFLPPLPPSSQPVLSNGPLALNRGCPDQSPGKFPSYQFYKPYHLQPIRLSI